MIACQNNMVDTISGSLSTGHMINLSPMKTNDHALLEAALIGYQYQVDQIESKMAELRSQLGGKTAAAPAKAAGAPAKKRQMSAAARKRIAAAQKKRWADYHRAQEGKA